MKKLLLIVMALIGGPLATHAFADSNQYSAFLQNGTGSYEVYVTLHSQTSATVSYGYYDDSFGVNEIVNVPVSFDQNGMGTIKVEDITGTIDINHNKLTIQKTNK